jgi:endoglucanase
MFKHCPKVIELRGLMLAGVLMILAGCGGSSTGGAGDPSTSDPPTGGSSPASVTVPAVPAGLAATAGNATVTLQWTASSGATSYNVKRATSSGGPYSQLAAPTAATYTDTSVTNGTTYFYVVSALDSAGESANSAQVSAAPAAPATTPAVPTGLAATAANASVALSWTASSGATSYHVKRATANGGPYTQIAAPTAATYADTSVSNGTTYYYVVSALDSTGESANSAQVSATPTASVTIPAMPTGLAATAGNALVGLTWSASSGATSYHVKRATTNGGPYTQVGAPTAATYTDASLSNGTAYYYVVSAVNSAGESANSAQVTATPTGSVGVNGVSVSGLHVSGNQIQNSQNQAVPLRGVDKSGAEYECLGGPLVFDGPSDANSVTVLQSWAINIVRLPVNEDCWLGINGVAVGGTTYQNAIVAYVNLLTAANIATIIDLQWNAPGTTLANAQVPMPDSDHAPAFWTSVATTFKSNSSVIFDLFNEPYPDSNQDSAAAWACLKNGGTCPGVAYPAASMQSLVNAVRATGSTNIVMVPGVQYTDVLDQWLANKPTDSTGNLVASWHSYAGQVCSSQSCWDSMVKPILQNTPVIAGEIGENDCADTYITPLMTYLDANGGNYLAWGWDTYDCSSFPALISDYTGTPTAFGLGFRNHLLILDGQTPP